MSTDPSPKTALKRLASRQPIGDEVKAVLNEMMRDGNDRAAALIGASLIDAVLKLYLLARMRELKNDEQVALFDGEGAPLGTLAAKTKLSYAFGICTAPERDEIDLIRLIRNQFAHSLIPLTFETKEVADICSRLTLELPAEKRGPRLGPGPRLRFIHSVVFLVTEGLALDALMKAMQPALQQ